jgi:hypothetical protein
MRHRIKLKQKILLAPSTSRKKRGKRSIYI